MKEKLKTLSLVALGSVLTLAWLVALSPVPAQAFLGTMGWPTVEPDHAYKLSASGRDVRVYEWQSQVIPGKACVMAFGDAGPVGLDCDVSPSSGSTSDAWE